MSEDKYLGPFQRWFVSGAGLTINGCYCRCVNARDWAMIWKRVSFDDESYCDLTHDTSTDSFVRSGPHQLDCNDCKHKFICVTDQLAIRTFERP